ncbi:hypothetical protein TNCV_4319081 [Trichonephila clavipes]|nr:hypothetical protein TNCV_4319081 [Trichonephila clavipes]
MKITALIDSGSTVSLLRENTSRRIMDPTKLSKNKMLLSGIGAAQVTTIGSFEHEFEIDDENYSLTWHVVSADKLKFEAVIGSDLLEQASISFTKEGVKFNKYENHAQLMQISVENLQELDLRHVENRQIKKELEKFQDYKPEKTASTDVTMRIILKDEEPVCQPPRRKAFTERQEVNKQIEEWHNEGIIRPSSSEYASPIVMELWFQQDGATCHTARATIDLLKDTFGDSLISRFGPVNWPPRSCDLTPLDYFLWGYVKSLVYADKPQTLDHLEGNIRRVIADIRPQMLEKVIENWTSRLDYIRSSRGKDYAKKELITRIARWALQLEEFDYEIEHRAGSRMKHVDVLSQYPVMIVCDDRLTSKLKKAQEEDDNLQTLKSLLEKQESEEFFERNGILYKYLNGRELIVTPKAMQTELIKLIHKNGRFSVGKTEEIVKQEFFIPNLSNVVKKVIVNCVPCILANKKTGKKEGFLNPISKESIPLSTYHVDFIAPLPSTNKSYQHIFPVVDVFTKFTWLYPVKTVSAESALEKLKQEQKTFGNPIRIIFDRGSAFTSKLFNDYCDEENIQHLQIATGVPRGNGQVERIHRTL